MRAFSTQTLGITVAFVVLLLMTGCSMETSSDGTGLYNYGSADAYGESTPLFEAVTLNLSETAYRCLCHRDIQIRASVRQEVQEQIAIGSSLNARVVTDQGDEAQLTLQYIPFEFTHASYLAIRDWEDSGWTSLYVVITGVVEGQQVNELYGFSRQETNITNLVGERLDPSQIFELVRQSGPAVAARLFVSLTGTVDFQAHSTGVRHMIDIAPPVGGTGSELNAEILVRGPESTEWINWGMVKLTYATNAFFDGRECARYTASFSLTKEAPEEPDPTEAMTVRLELSDVGGVSVQGAVEYEIVEGVPDQDSVVVE